MNVEELRWFVTVAERGRVTQAAAELHISQPALSRALGRLQRELGVDLFDRSGRTLRLNRYGELYLDHVRRALGELDSGRRALEEMAGGEQGLVSLGFAPTLSTWLVPALVSAFRGEHPGPRFQLHQDAVGPLVEALRDGGVDLLITPRPGDPELGWHALGRERLELVVPPGHRLAGRRRVRLAEASGERFVMLKHAFDFRDLVEDLCREAGFAPESGFEAEDIASARALVAAGLGVAVVPPLHGGGELARGGVHIELSDPTAVRSLGIAWDEQRYRSPATELFRSFVIERGAQLASSAPARPDRS
jgi:LysR family transcriptional regulator, transcription activator of glutamate synthase operon